MVLNQELEFDSVTFTESSRELRLGACDLRRSEKDPREGHFWHLNILAPFFT